MIRRVKRGFLIVKYGDVRSRADVLVHHVVECRIEYRIASGKEGIALGASADIAGYALERFHGAAVKADIIACDKRRQHEQTVALSVQIPFLSRAEMIHQGMVVLLRDDADVGHARIGPCLLSIKSMQRYLPPKGTAATERE